MFRFVIVLSLIIFIIPQIQSQSESEEQIAMEQISMIDENSTDSTMSAVSLDSSSTTIITETSETVDSSTTAINTGSSESIDSSTTSINTDPSQPTDTSTISINTESSEPTDISTTSINTEESTDSSTSSITTESEDSTSSDTTVSPEDTTTIEPTTSKTSLDTTEESSSTSISTTGIPTTTTPPPLIPIFSCNFNIPCFGGDELKITNGLEFNPPFIDNNTPPPRAPFSDVTSILDPTSDGSLCAFPYPPEVDNPPNWNMSFCYKDHCSTTKLSNATCAPGFYGLLALTPSESSKAVSQLISSTADPSATHELTFYYYFTVSLDGTNCGQQIQLWIHSGADRSVSSSIANLTVDDMKDYHWQSRKFPLPSLSNDSTLQFIFRIDNENSTACSTLDEPIYFALDNIEIWEKKKPTTTTTITTTITSTSPTTATTADTGTRPPDSDSNLAIILGVSLGIGIPVLFILIGGTIVYRRRNRRRDENAYDIPLRSKRPRTNSDIFSNPYLF